MPDQVTATTLHIPEPAITDLRERLARTRFPDQAPGPAWSYGTDLEYLRGLVDYWATRFDWRAQEARLNAFPQYKTALLDIIRLLTDPARFGGDPADAFSVVAPSLPGYGLSFAPGQPRFGIEEIADAFAALMQV